LVAAVVTFVAADETPRAADAGVAELVVARRRAAVVPVLPAALRDALVRPPVRRVVLARAVLVRAVLVRAVLARAVLARAALARAVLVRAVLVRVVAFAALRAALVLAAGRRAAPVVAFLVDLIPDLDFAPDFGPGLAAALR
jgi:hypothetical protein